MARPVTRTVRGHRFMCAEPGYWVRVRDDRWQAHRHGDAWIARGLGIPGEWWAGDLDAALGRLAEAIIEHDLAEQQRAADRTPAPGRRTRRAAGHTWRKDRDGIWLTVADGEVWEIRRIDSRGAENGWYVTGPRVWSTDPAGDRCELVTDAYSHAARLIAEHAAHLNAAAPPAETATDAVIRRYADAVDIDPAQVWTMNDREAGDAVIVPVDHLAALLDRLEAP